VGPDRNQHHAVNGFDDHHLADRTSNPLEVLEPILFAIRQVGTAATNVEKGLDEITVAGRLIEFQKDGVCSPFEGIHRAP